MIKRILDKCDHLVENRKLIRRLLILWATSMITFVTHEIVLVMRNMDEVTAPVVSFYLGVTGLLTAVIGLYQFLRQKDGEEGKR